MSKDKKPVVKPALVKVKLEPAAAAAPVAPAPAKVEAPKTVAAAPIVPAPVKVETPKAEVAKVEAPKVTAAAPAPAKVEAPKAAAPKPAPVKAEAPKVAQKTPTGAATVADVLKPFAVLQEQFRAQAEKGAAQARANYATMKGNAETATAKLEESLVAARTGAKALGDKVIEAVQAQAKAHIDHAQKLGSVKTIEEAAKLQHAFLLEQMDAFRARTVDFASFTQKIANDISEPAKASFAATWTR